ncbi:MAG: ribosome biogenesis GTPase Der [Candidatus Kerfeldbacteria bacterium]|nr:ribosome biogenesis GTPase Der [Candidatus Kerfeldbacteria bacterium]
MKSSSSLETPFRLPVVLLVGRTNVGKSTLLNRVVGTQVAMVSDIAGTTRDRLQHSTSWRGVPFLIMDSGGYIVRPVTSLERETEKQLRSGLKTADVILFMVDGMEGLHPLDQELALRLKAAHKPVIVCVNKMERNRDSVAITAEFHALGFPDIFEASALTGSGVGDLLDAIVDRLGEPLHVSESRGMRLTFVGKPNVGKSSLVNAILQDDRVVVTELPHTTREPQDLPFRFGRRDVVLVDTAGLHPVRKLRYNSGLRMRGRLEIKGMEWTERRIAMSDVCLFVIESHGSLSTQDYRIADVLAHHPASGIVVVANKLDLLEDSTRKMRRKITETIHRVLPNLPEPAVVFTSTVTGEGIPELLPTAFRVFRKLTTAYPKEELRTVIENFFETHVAPLLTPDDRRAGRIIRVMTVKQSSVRPREVEILYQSRKTIPANLIGRLQHELSEHFQSQGISLMLQLRRV